MWSRQVDDNFVGIAASDEGNTIKWLLCLFSYDAD